MSLLLIVLLLDKSHLELIEDVLKENNFNNEDWEKLGQELGVHDKSLKYSYSGNFLNLKECLRKWLTNSDTTRHFLLIRSSTLYDLAVALDSIGYNEAAEYIIKTCKLIIMFNDQCYTS